MLKENNKIKNSVLIDLFYEDESAKKNQIALYNALHEDNQLQHAIALPDVHRTDL